MSKKGKVFMGIIVTVLLVVGFVFGLGEFIPTGTVGVVYNMNGGVQGETLSQGFHVVPPTKHIKEFSISNEQLILSKKGENGNESFLVSTSDNANIKISFQMSYRYDEARVVDTYKKFKGMDGEQIINSRVKTVLVSKISEVTSGYTMMDIYSGNRSKINADITKFLQSQLSTEFGIEVIDATIIDVHPDEQLEKSIKDRVTAMQKKQQAEAEQATVIVENETKLLKAQNEAEIKITEANATAEANRVIASSITTPLIDMANAEARKIHGWVTVQTGTTLTEVPAQ